MVEDKIAALENRVKNLESRLEAMSAGKGKQKREQKPRAPTEYNKFIKDTYNELKENNPSMKHTEIFAECVKKWKARNT